VKIQNLKFKNIFAADSSKLPKIKNSNYVFNANNKMQIICATTITKGFFYFCIFPLKKRTRLVGGGLLCIFTNSFIRWLLLHAVQVQ